MDYQVLKLLCQRTSVAEICALFVCLIYLVDYLLLEALRLAAKVFEYLDLNVVLRECLVAIVKLIIWLYFIRTFFLIFLSFRAALLFDLTLARLLRRNCFLLKCRVLMNYALVTLFYLFLDLHVRNVLDVFEIV